MEKYIIWNGSTLGCIFIEENSVNFSVRLLAINFPRTKIIKFISNKPNSLSQQGLCLEPVFVKLKLLLKIAKEQRLHFCPWVYIENACPNLDISKAESMSMSKMKWLKYTCSLWAFM